MLSVSADAIFAMSASVRGGLKKRKSGEMCVGKLQRVRAGSVVKHRTEKLARCGEAVRT
jgi:hypothetical protein